MQTLEYVHHIMYAILLKINQPNFFARKKYLTIISILKEPVAELLNADTRDWV